MARGDYRGVMRYGTLIWEKRYAWTVMVTNTKNIFIDLEKGK